MRSPDRKKAGVNRRRAGETRLAIIELLKTAPNTNRVFAGALKLPISGVSQLIVEMRTIGKPVYIKTWIRSPVTKCWAAVYAWGEGDDADLADCKRKALAEQMQAVRACDIRPHRDWAVFALFGPYSGGSRHV